MRMKYKEIYNKIFIAYYNHLYKGHNLSPISTLKHFISLNYTKEFETTFRNISCAVIVAKYLLVAEQSINSCSFKSSFNFEMNLSIQSVH